ncbi:Putative peptidase, partial [Candidatus Arthromitus sp. SFB-co]
DTSFGRAEVIGLSILKERIKVKIIVDQDEEIVRDIDISDIKECIFKNSRDNDNNTNYFINDIL